MRGLARHLTLTQRLLAIVAMSVVPAAAGLLYFILAIHADREREVRDQALRTSELAALEIERIITGADGVLRTIALVPSIRHRTADCDVFLAEARRPAAAAPRLRRRRPEGTVRCASGFSFGPDGVAGQSWLRPALASASFVVGEYTRSAPEGTAYLPVAVATGDDGDRTVVMTGIDLGWLGARLRERSPRRRAARFAVADRNGVLLAREPEPGTLRREPASRPPTCRWSARRRPAPPRS